MPPRCYVDRCISQEARGGGRSRKPFPTHINLVDGFRGASTALSHSLRRERGSDRAKLANALLSADGATAPLLSVDPA